MPKQFIDLSAAVEADRIRARHRVDDAVSSLISWTQQEARGLPLHRVTPVLFDRLMALGCLLVVLWWAWRIEPTARRILRPARASYCYRGLSAAAVRTRFGVVWLRRPVYELVSGSGPPLVSPADRRMGLAAGRMSLCVHLLTSWLVAQMTFDGAIAVLGRLCGYTPSKRSSLGIIDHTGAVAIAFLAEVPPPEGDGEILVIAFDDKAAPMIRASEHSKRCGKRRKKRSLSLRVDRKHKGKENPRRRKKQGDKTKNGRSAKLAVVYTLRRLSDGSIEGPINRRVFGTFGSRSTLVSRVRKEALARGYGVKKTIFLADGATTLWDIWREHFSEATPCLDWFHLCEYLWAAGATIHRAGSKVLAKWVRARKKELRAGNVDAVLVALEAAGIKVSGKGRGADARRQRVADAFGYVENHRDQMPYADFLEEGLDIATGVMEGAVKHAVATRLDGSGMRWSPQRAEFVLALRLVSINGLWEEFEEHAAVEHEKSEAWTIPRVTPQGPQNVDPRCLDAA